MELRTGPRIPGVSLAAPTGPGESPGAPIRRRFGVSCVPARPTRPAVHSAVAVEEVCAHRTGRRVSTERFHENLGIRRQNSGNQDVSGDHAQELADRAGVSKDVVCRLEQGARAGLRLQNLYKVVDALHAEIRIEVVAEDDVKEQDSALLLPLRRLLLPVFLEVSQLHVTTLCNECDTGRRRSAASWAAWSARRSATIWAWSRCRPWTAAVCSAPQLGQHRGWSRSREPTRAAASAPVVASAARASAASPAAAGSASASSRAPTAARDSSSTRRRLSRA